MMIEIIYFVAGLLVGVFRKQIVAYVKQQQALQRARRKAQNDKNSLLLSSKKEESEAKS